MLARIQNDLFDVGADLCVPGEGGDRLRLTDAPSVRLEAEVAAMNAGLPKLTSFVLPGGSPGRARGAHGAGVGAAGGAGGGAARRRGGGRRRRCGASSTACRTICSCWRAG